MKRPLRIDRRAQSEAIFGSWARGTKDRLSDRDILIVDDDVAVLKMRSEALKAEGWSVAPYTFRKLKALAQRKALFIQHLKLESDILIDVGDCLSAILSAFEPKANYDSELAGNARLAELLSVIGSGARSEAWAADLLYVALRNFGVLSLASRGVHLYAYDQILDALTDHAIISAESRGCLQRLRFIKYLYRSGEAVGSGQVLRIVRDALVVLPRGAFPTEIAVVAPQNLLAMRPPPQEETAYVQLRDLEKRMLAAQALSGGALADPELQALQRWIADPRIYANLSASMSARLRTVLNRYVCPTFTSVVAVR